MIRLLTLVGLGSFAEPRAHRKLALQLMCVLMTGACLEFWAFMHMHDEIFMALNTSCETHFNSQPGQCSGSAAMRAQLMTAATLLLVPPLTGYVVTRLLYTFIKAYCYYTNNSSTSPGVNAKRVRTWLGTTSLLAATALLLVTVP